MSNEREAIAKTIHEAEEIAGIRDSYAMADPRSRYTRTTQAAAVIQYLWQRADDPEVLGAITTFCWPDRDIEWWSTLNDIDKAGYNSSTRTDVAAVLTALLGPRPSGEGEEHGQH